MGLSDLAELGLVLADVVTQRHQHALGVRRRHDDPRPYARLGHARHHANEVEHELLRRVRDHHEVSVVPLGDLFGELDGQGRVRGRRLHVSSGRATRDERFGG